MKKLQIAEGCDEMATNRSYRIGNKVRFNDFWHHNVHLGGGAESESPIPGGMHGTIVGLDEKIPGVYLVATPLGEETVHVSYIDPVKDRHTRG